MYLSRSQPVFLSHHSYLYLHLWTSSQLEEVTHLARRSKTKHISSIAAPNLLCRTNTVQIQSTSQLQIQTKLNATVLSKERGKTRSGGSLVTDSHKRHHWRVFARGLVTLIRGTDLIALLCICARLVFRICVG